jgi:hypothetical protein
LLGEDNRLLIVGFGGFAKFESFVDVAVGLGVITLFGLAIGEDLVSVGVVLNAQTRKGLGLVPIARL